MRDLACTLIHVGGKTVGGMLAHPMLAVHSFWLSYVLVDDLAAMTEKAKSLGAKVVRDITEVPDTDWFSILQDPSGGSIALWKPKR